MVTTNISSKSTVVSRDEITAAIRNAEQTTSGEIFAVLAQQSDNYLIISFFMWTIGIFFCSIILAFVFHWRWHDIPLHYFAITILFCHLIGLFYLSIIPGLRLAITPTPVKNYICHENAIKQFLAQNVHRTEKRTGILLFISLTERYAEIIADTKISKKVPPQTWNEIVASMIEKARQNDVTGAYIVAIEKSGNILSEYFPAKEHIANELPDHIVEI